MTTLVVAAFSPELAPYRIDPPMPGVELAEVGIGLVAASLGAAEVLRRRPGAVVFSGTCGAYPGGPSLLDVAISSRIRLVSPLAVEGRAHLPALMSPPLDADPSLVAALVAAGGHSCEVATTLAITTDDALAAAVFASGCAVEHLESYAVAAACARASIPFVAVLGVANRVGSSAHAEWKRNHEAASLRAASVVRAALRG